MICPRCATEKPGIHTCKPSEYVKKIEVERDALLAQVKTEEQRKGEAIRRNQHLLDALLKISSHNSDHPSAVWLQKIAREALEGK